MSDRTPGNKVSDALEVPSESVLETCDRFIRLRIPNLLRLYLNPWVVQTCVCLDHLVHALWPLVSTQHSYPSFLANSGEEALSGAIKLARYTLSRRQDATKLGPSPRVIVIADDDHFLSFCDQDVQDDVSGLLKTVVFLPDIVVMCTAEFLKTDAEARKVGTLVLSPSATGRNMDLLYAAVDEFQRDTNGLVIACVTADQVDRLTRGTTARMTPDIVVFDESFTGYEVPFGAFSASAEIYAQWTRKGMSTFHSTTYQPNTISTMHFVKCLEQREPEIFQSLKPELENLLVDHKRLKKQFRDLYNPALGRLISGTNFGDDDVTASEHYVRVGNRKLFDGVGGVACSLRGHNPVSWTSEIRSMPSGIDVRAEIGERLAALTGLLHHVPAVSGASAVEHALKLALVTQFPKEYVVVLRGGFGGKTLFALTGTEKNAYKRGLGPLYPHVLYVDPFAADAIEQIDRAVRDNPVALIQLELIQGVGGVREIPRPLLEHLASLREKTGVALFVDEIQTGMFRTGPFVRSCLAPFVPDLLTIGKGTSDMIFPFALTLYSDRIDSLLKQKATLLPSQLRHKNEFDVGYRSVLNSLRRSFEQNVSERVIAAADQFREALSRELDSISIVRDIRVFGLLIGIELRLDSTLLQKLKLNTSQLYLLQMMQHKTFPLLMGYCQYEPNILKFTPPLTITSEEIELTSRVIGDALRTSQFRMLSTGIRALLRARS